MPIYKVILRNGDPEDVFADDVEIRSDSLVFRDRDQAIIAIVPLHNLELAYQKTVEEQLSP